MPYKYILFDLDGTLTDPGIGITNAVMYALRQFNITVEDRTSLYKFIGPPLWASFEQFYGFSKEEADRAVAYYREYYKDKGLFENAVYPGINDLLASLTAHGKTLLVATSKPEVFAKQILEHFGLTAYFTLIAGSELDGTRVHKHEVIRYALDRGHIDPAEAVMVGDREHDIIGAKKIGIASVGVLFGYGSRGELEQAGADNIAESVTDLQRVLIDLIN